MPCAGPASLFPVSQNLSFKHWTGPGSEAPPTTGLRSLQPQDGGRGCTVGRASFPLRVGPPHLTQSTRPGPAGSPNFTGTRGSGLGGPGKVCWARRCEWKLRQWPLQPPGDRAAAGLHAPVGGAGLGGLLRAPAPWTTVRCLGGPRTAQR